VTAPATAKSDHSSTSTRAAFWLLASLGVIASAVAWAWYGFAQFEAQTEQPKALSADTTMAGFAEVIGGVPLILAHLIGLILLLVVGWWAYGKRGIALAIVAVIVASGIGIIVAQILWGGELFQLGINNNTYLP